MTNKDLTMFMAQVTRRAADWTHDCLTAGRTGDDQVRLDTKKRFCQDIRDILERIEDHP